MKLPTQKKVLREDVKDAPNWITPILETLNSFMESVYQALNRNITFSENILCQIKEITYRTGAAYPGTPELPFEFLSTLKVKATGLSVLQAIEKTTYEPARGPVYVPWVENNGTIVLGTITGLEPSKVYIIRLLVS